MSKHALNRLRQKIEALDLELLAVLNKRASTCLEIGKLKSRLSLDVHDPWREKALFACLAEHNRGPLKPGQIEEIFQRIVSVSRRIQSSVSLAGFDPQAESADKNLSVTPSLPSSETSLYGILGNPITHSMSPLMQNTAFRLLGLDAIYLSFQTEDLPSAVAGMKALRVKGASVTHPFKQEIIKLIDSVDETAKKIGAVNTLVFGDDTIRGTNTDWQGALRCLENLIPIQGHRFVVVGAGGAARAVIFGISRHGGEIVVVNRSKEKGQALADELGCTFVPLSEIQSIGGDCLVNTTPVGMYPKPDQMPIPTQALGTYKAVADVIYNPLKTMLIKKAEAAGCMVASGLEMFVYQGVEQFNTWTGRQAPVKEMRQVVYERLCEK